MEQRADFLVNEKLALGVALTACFQQVKNIIRSERKELVRDGCLHAGKHSSFSSEHAPYRAQEKYIVGLCRTRICRCAMVCCFRLKNFKASAAFESLHFLHLSCDKEPWLTHWLSPQLPCVKTGGVRTPLFLFHE